MVQASWDMNARPYLKQEKEKEVVGVWLKW
jgi:hypothetical protein